VLLTCQELEGTITFPPAVTSYVRAMVRRRTGGSGVSKDRTVTRAGVAISENTQSYKAKSIVEAIDGAMRADFGKV